MNKYYLILIIISLLAIIGVFIFIFDFSDLSWMNNKEAYWGILAMIAIIGFILLNNHSQNLAKQIKEAEENRDKKKNL